jgi:hypothetical protein
MRRVVAFAACAVPLALVGDADAHCRWPELTLAPDYSDVPAHSFLRLFVPEGGRPTPPRVVARDVGGAVPLILTPEARGPTLRVYRLEIPSAREGALQIEVLDDSGNVKREFSLRVNPSWTAPTTSAATVSVEQVSTYWTCSHTQTKNLRFTGGAVSYRVLIADSPSDLASGNTRFVILPHTIAALYGLTAPQHAVDLALGYVSCLGDTFAFAARPIWVQVQAQLPDGSEQVVNTAPIRIEPPDPRVPPIPVY